MIHDFDGVPLSLPEWVTEFRPHQVQAVREILDHFDHRKVVMVDAPTGAGKTLIGEMVRQVLMWRKMTNKGIYVCSSKTLQEQILHDFPYARVIKGRSNYPTLDNPKAFDYYGDRHLSAANCTKYFMEFESWPVCDRCEDYPPDRRFSEAEGSDFLHCHTCHPWQSCPYEVAKDAALDARLTVANTAYFLTEANYVGRFGAQDSKTNPWHSRLLIMDEADTLESIILNYVELDIPKRALRELDLGVPHKVTVPEAWLEWCEAATNRIQGHVTELAKKVGEYHNEPPPTKLQDELDRWGKHLHQVQQVAGHIRQDPEGWVLDGYNDGKVSFRPIEVHGFARELLWRHSERFLLMSATLVSPRQMAADLGLQDHEWESVEVSSSFPVERRLVNVRGTAKMAFKTKDVEWPKLAEGIADILSMYPDDRVLIHTVSYELTEFLMDKLKLQFGERLFTYANAKEREKVLETYRRTLGAVLLAPSLERGVDLKDEDCRVVIVTKVPFPSLGDKRISQRLYGTRTGESWYCVAPRTKVLRDDLRWVEASALNEGDRLFGFDEQGPWRRWKPTIVESIGMVTKPSYRMTLSDGTVLVSSSEHQWLTRLHPTSNKMVWKSTEQIACPPANKASKDYLIRLLDTWEDGTSRDDGYLAAFFDADGTLSQITGKGKTSPVLTASISQNDGAAADEAVRVANALGFKLSKYERTSTAKDLAAIYTLNGGREEVLRLLGQVRPVKLLDKFDINKLAGHINRIASPSVEEIEYLGETELIGMQTSTRTFLAEGMASHNSMQTVRSLVQMTGRAMRHEGDYMTAYILDSQFIHITWKSALSRNMIPRWWAEALVWEAPKRKSS